ncbi:hypothetical protein KBY24_08690 [Ruegeria pomeroyi]|nr:hypothetical protein [Ruegeria alba]MCE8521160.1 hypothetical protein [Ruegeria pomeroyi]MCE8533460.1 hypothetical protein [Ruegeria pomeroyi]
MLLMTSSLHAQAAAYRLAGYAISNQLRAMQILSRAALNAPLAQVQALQAAAAAPAPQRTVFASAKTTAPKPTKPAAETHFAADTARQGAIAPALATSAQEQKSAPASVKATVAATHPAPRRRRKPSAPAPLPAKAHPSGK